LPRGRKLIFSSALARSLRETLASGGQSILFLNRRGFSTQIACFECQDVARCKHCDISLTYHAADQRLRCHYCDYQTPPPDVCARCGAPSTALLGIGTERLEEEVRIHLPEARVARLDRDTSARRGAAEEILSSLRAGELDVLVGTQMVAKGHDFSGVALVGVVNADLGLHFPDFRAAERTFQLLTQVAGRAGRGATPGRVIVQTYAPDHYAVRPVIEHDFERFFREELQHRRLLGYPPFSCLARVLVSGPDEDATREAAERLAGAARTALAAGGPGETTDGAPCEILGPAPAPIARLRGRHRFQLLIKHETRERVWSLVRRVSEAAATLRGDLRTSVDMSPVDML
jgi:primosomal protein N' (replication factor Y)